MAEPAFAPATPEIPGVGAHQVAGLGVGDAEVAEMARHPVGGLVPALPLDGALRPLQPLAGALDDVLGRVGDIQVRRSRFGYNRSQFENEPFGGVGYVSFRLKTILAGWDG
jgi:hypothetical protein